MFQDSVPAGSYNDPFLSSVCLSLSLLLARSTCLYLQTWPLSVLCPLSRLAMTGRPRVRAVGKHSTDAPVDPDLLRLSPDHCFELNPPGPAVMMGTAGTGAGGHTGQVGL